MRTHFLCSCIILVALLNVITIMRLTHQSPHIAKKPRLIPDLNLPWVNDEPEQAAALGDCGTSAVAGAVYHVLESEPLIQRKSSRLTLVAGTVRTLPHDLAFQSPSSLLIRSKISNGLRTQSGVSTTNQPVLNELAVEEKDRNIEPMKQPQHGPPWQETRGASEAFYHVPVPKNREANLHEISRSREETASAKRSSNDPNPMKTYSWGFLRVGKPNTTHQNKFLGALFDSFKSSPEQDYQVEIQTLPDLISSYSLWKLDSPGYDERLRPNVRARILGHLLIEISDSIFEVDHISNFLGDFLETFHKTVIERVRISSGISETPHWSKELSNRIQGFFIRVTKIVPVMIMMVSTLVRDFRGEKGFPELLAETSSYMRTLWYDVMEGKVDYPWAAQLYKIVNKPEVYLEKNYRTNRLFRDPSSWVRIGWKIASLWLFDKRRKIWELMEKKLGRPSKGRIHQHLVEILSKILYFSNQERAEELNGGKNS